MKYWLLTTEFPPLYGGGISTYCYFTTQMLASKGHQVTVFVPDWNTPTDLISETDNIRIIRFAPNRTNTKDFMGYIAFLSYEFAHVVGDYLKKESCPDILETQDYQGIGYYLHMYKLFGYEHFRDLTVVTSIHATALSYMKVNKEPIYKLPGFWMGEMEKFSVLASDLVITPSNYIIDRLAEDFRIRDREVNLVRYPIRSTSPKPEFSFERNNIMFFGKMVYTKGGFHLIEYFKTLWDQGFTHSLKIIGETNLHLHLEDMNAMDYINSKYQKYIDEGLLIFTGKLQLAEAQEHLKKAHIVIIPSLIDNFPYTVMETMLEGKLVLASRQGGHSELVEDGQTGFLFDHTQPQTFFTQLQKALALTDEEISSFGKKAYEKIINDFNFATIYEQKMRVIERYLQQKPASNRTFPYIRPVPMAVNPEELELNGSQKDLLSVVIPYYNLGDLVIETVESVLRSAYNNLEILVVDDGSNAESQKSLATLKSKYPDVIVLHKKNSGLSDSRNYGAKHAKGEYLAFLDADDLIYPDYYEKAVRVLKQYDNVHFVGCWSKYFENNDGYWLSVMPEPPFILFHNTMHCALIYKKASYLTTGNDASMKQGLEDWECIVHMTSKGLSGVSLPEALFHYRVRTNSMARKLTKTKFLDLYSYVAKKHHQFYARYASDLVNLLNSNGSGLYLDNPTIDKATHGISGNIITNKFNSRLRNIVSKNYYLKKIALKVKRLIE
jgi:glycosyltransferase involved in cell wall biosynthesis